MPELSRWVRGEWVAVICGLVTIVVVLAYCAWRLQVMGDFLARQEVEFARIMAIQRDIQQMQHQAIEGARRR